MKEQLLILMIILGIPIIMFSRNEINFDGSELNFQTVDDYKKYEGKILILINWLKNHSLEEENWKKGKLIFLKWIGETPTVRIMFDEYLTLYTKKNPELFVLFLAGWTDFVLRNPDEKDCKLKTNLAGINTVLDYYSKGDKFGLKLDRSVESLIKKRDEGKLERYIKRETKYRK